MKNCVQPEPQCLANHTMTIVYQYIALPAISTITHPVEVSRIRAEATDGISLLTIKYILDKRSSQRFIVIQEKQYGK
ncbi:unnamed protein product [Soboliphyme baturini]|uniref:Uncharacterized protein n=1 Tax=Soboliphyme baturini TaxID=241478 RepID=A0A183JA73_9BILA|nr:unnamed protein product [Soboliphyme baturini]